MSAERCGDVLCFVLGFDSARKLIVWTNQLDSVIDINTTRDRLAIVWSISIQNVTDIFLVHYVTAMCAYRLELPLFHSLLFHNLLFTNLLFHNLLLCNLLFMVCNKLLFCVFLIRFLCAYFVHWITLLYRPYCHFRKMFNGHVDNRCVATKWW